MNNKELELTVKDKIEVSIEQEQKFQQKHIGSIHPHRGHTLFEVNLATGEIEPAEFQQQDYVVGSDINSGGGRKKVIMKPDCVYISALNKRNALKKFMNRKVGDKFK
jgi:desulfoferrodoxin (superoxide reductase-like protein)